ncbi:MAG: DoxX family protein [Chitinophagaceae bacterium]
MKKLLATDPNNWAAFVARIILGLVVFPHGAQKLLGWFGGYGFEGTMGYMTGQMNLPWIIGFLVIIIESIGSLLLIIGFFTRIAALAILCNFIGIILHSNLDNGFFMNWDMLPDRPEGYEYHLLILGVSFVLIIMGGGKWSIDAVLSKNYSPITGNLKEVNTGY